MCSSMKAVMRAASSSVRGEVGQKVVVIGISRRDKPAQASKLGQMMVGIAEQGIDHGGSLEIVPHLVLHGHADPAVKLDRLLADKTSGAADLHLRGRDRFAPLARVRRLLH